MIKAVAASAPYLVTAILCFILTSTGRRSPSTRLIGAQRLAWKIICASLLLLTALRPYEVYSELTQFLRNSAMRDGWYDQRGGQQADLLYVTAFLLAVLGLFALVETRRWHLSTRAAVLGLFYLVGLLVLSILSLHGLDRLLGRELMGIPLRWLLDFAGLAVLVGAAYSFRGAYWTESGPA